MPAKFAAGPIDVCRDGAARWMRDLTFPQGVMNSQANLEHHQMQTNGITLHVVQSGPLDGPLAILLHGFPEFWMAWENQIDALVAAGFRVWVPDQRGYNLSDKPRGIDAYRLETLVADITGLIDQAGHDKVYLLGHDWGGALAWQIAHRHPGKLAGVVIVSAPHFKVFREYTSSNARQMLRSWYMLFFRIPCLPEWLLGFRKSARLVKALRGSGRPGTFSDAMMVQYREAWRQPRALNAMLNWYRALLRNRPVSQPPDTIHVPTLLIWGKLDHALGVEMAQPSIDLCEVGKLRVIDDAGHWVLHEEPEAVNRLICRFLEKLRTRVKQDAWQ
jgi:epoxide hydrolase 4